MLDEALFVWTNALAALFAVRMVRRLLPDADLPTRILGWIAAFVATTEACLLMLGAIGAVRAIPLAVIVAAFVAAERAWPGAPKRDDSATIEPLDPLDSLDRPPRWSRWAWGSAALVAALALYWIGVTVGSGVGYSWDDLSYHAPTVAWFAKTGTLSVPPFNYQSYYAMNAELHGLWFVLPLGIDAHANLANLSWMALAVAGFAVHSRVLAHSPALSGLVLAGFLASPKVRVALAWFTPNDHALAGLIVAMLALAWVPRLRAGRASNRPPRSAVGRAFLCGVVGGIALGTKPLAAPLVAVVGISWLWRTWREPQQGALRHAAAFAVGVVLFGSAWYVRNWALTGNPVFPAAIGPFAGPLTPAAQQATSLAAVIARDSATPGFWADLVNGRLNWPVPFGCVSVAGYFVGLWALLRDRDPARRAHRVLLLTAGMVYFCQFPFQPFSGTSNRPDAPIIHVVRYLLIPFIVGLIVFPSIWPNRTSTPRATATERRLPRWTPPAIGLVLLTLLALSTPFKNDAARRPLEYERPDSPIRRQWQALESLPDGARLAALTHDPASHAMYYPLFGRRLQHRPVAIYGDGRERGALHEAWRDEPAGWWWEFDDEPELAQLLPNLLEAEVDYLLVAKWPKRSERAPWPASREKIASTLAAEACVYADGYAEIWDLNGERRAPAPSTAQDEQE